ncbi:hypothetical protein D3C85_1712410 [compost metagenome]
MRTTCSRLSLPQMPQPVRPASVRFFSFRRWTQRLARVICSSMPWQPSTRSMSWMSCRPSMIPSLSEKPMAKSSRSAAEHIMTPWAMPL